MTAAILSDIQPNLVLICIDQKVKMQSEKSIFNPSAKLAQIFKSI